MVAGAPGKRTAREPFDIGEAASFIEAGLQLFDGRRRDSLLEAIGTGEKEQ